MKVRVVKEPDGNCIPQYKEESGKFAGSWREINLEGDFAMHYYDEKEAKEICEEFKKKTLKERGQVIWEDEF